jgi:mono/diheme cytochrome c family protein
MKAKKNDPPTDPEGSFLQPHWAILLVFLILVASFGCQPFSDAKKDMAPSSGEELFQSKCSKCHDIELAMSNYRSEGVWFATITRMREEHHAEISRDEVEQLVKFHVARQKQEAKLFKEKCRKCHPNKALFDKRLNKAQVRDIIRRMQQKVGNSIEDKDVEILVRYHIQAQRLAVEENLQGIYRQPLAKQPALKRGMALFLKKCSTCHSPGMALAVIKDPDVWAQTIMRMQLYSKGAITDLEAKKLVGFHVSLQQREINTFRETCTKCHDDQRINTRSLSEEQWLATIRRMQQKAPELITDEKVNLLAAYFHRRELTMARIFSGKCSICHLKKEPPSRIGTSEQLNSLIVMASEEAGESLDLSDVNNLLTTHVERQKRSIMLYERKCENCHPEGSPKKKKADQENRGGRSRADWISYIAELQGEELSKNVQGTINGQIDYHISRH